MQFLWRHNMLDASSVEAARAGVHLFRRFERYDALGDASRFRLVVNSLLLDGVRLAAVRSSGHLVQPVDTENATLLIAHRGVLEADDGRQARPIRDGHGMLLRPGRRTTRIPGPYTGFVVQLPIALLAARAASNPADGPLPDAGWAAPLTPQMLRAVRYVVTELDAPEAVALSPRLARGLSLLLTDVMIDGLQGASPEGPVAEPALALVRRAEEMLRARVGEDVSITALSGALGVSTRALQAGFRRYRATTPRAFLASLRLEAVRARLVVARPGESVTGIAHDCGILHVSRFAAAYRARYGEAPSATLTRALRRA